MNNQVFKIGEIAIINCPHSRHYGKECEILSPLLFRLIDSDWREKEEDYCYKVSISGHGNLSACGRPLGFRPSELRKRPDDKPFTSWFNEHIIVDPIASPREMTNIYRSIRENPERIQPFDCFFGGFDE